LERSTSLATARSRRSGGATPDGGRLAIAGASTPGVRAPGERGELSGRRGRDGLEVPLEAVRLASEHRARCEHVRLAAEATDALEAAHKLRFVHGACASELVRGWSLCDQLGELFVDRLLDGCDVASLFDGGLNEEDATELVVPDAGAYLVH
jgi:hypothetical protein